MKDSTGTWNGGGGRLTRPGKLGDMSLEKMAFQPRPEGEVWGGAGAEAL